MRVSPSFIPEQDAVAIHGSRIVGNIVDATSVIRADDGKEYEVLGMGPIAVLPEYQRRGIGRRIIGMRQPSRSLSGLKGRYVKAAVYHMDEKRAAEFDGIFR